MTALTLADLIARAFETLASAPDLTPEERTAVRDRMTRAVEDCTPIVSIPPPAEPCAAKHGGFFCAKPADHGGEHESCGGRRWPQSSADATATARELAYFDAEAAAINVPPLCFAKIPGGMCLLDRGHDEPCTNERTVVRA